MIILGALTVNPIACTPVVAPSGHWSVYENDDRPALSAAILVDVLSHNDFFCSHAPEFTKPLGVISRAGATALPPRGKDAYTSCAGGTYIDSPQFPQNRSPQHFERR
jgi:hypothetical protein